MSFYFPYNFYPVTGEVKQGDTTDKPRYTFDYTRTTDNKGNPTTAQLARHDVWQKHTYSGQFTVQFITKTPTLIGNTHKKKCPNDKDSPYYWNDQLAFPANSLRGMISSIAETLSQSTLRILDEKYHPAFENINSDLIPWKKERTKLTPAEMLFGVVDADGKDAGNTQNLASRVRFSDAILQGNNTEALTDTEIPLKELASPKPDGELPKIGGNDANLDAYNHYFKHKDTLKPATHGDVLKGEIKNLKPLGRKFYLNRRQIKEADYTGTDGAARSMKGRLIKSEQVFKSTIRFNNLSKAELTLLKTSIKPSPYFWHHIGLGKALGLGALQVSSLQINTIDRKERYSKKTLGTTATQLELDINELNDNHLIDKGTLTILINANNFINLPDAAEVHWRDGRNETTRPIPTLYPQQNGLPIAEEIIETTDNQTPHETKSEQTATDKDLTEKNTEAGKWLKKVIGQLNNNTTYEELGHDNIVTIIKGKALSKQWFDLAESELKQQVLILIKQQMKLRNIEPNDLATVAEKRYFPPTP